MKLIPFSILTLLSAFLAGCGGSDGPKIIAEPGKAALEDLAVALKQLAADNQKPPTKMAEMDTLDVTAPVGGASIRNGEVVYFWGNPYLNTSSKILAYEKKAETEGGYVLLQNGTVKKMTAEEFKSAEKAGKK